MPRDHVPQRIISLVLFIGTILAALLLSACLSACSSPLPGPPDPFDQALGSLMAQRAALYQAQAARMEGGLR